MLVKKGRGGTVKYGYEVVAQVESWKYEQDAPEAGGVDGGGTVTVNLHEINSFWVGQETRFDLYLAEGRATWFWLGAEMISDTCFLVPSGPERR